MTVDHIKQKMTQPRMAGRTSSKAFGGSSAWDAMVGTRLSAERDFTPQSKATHPSRVHHWVPPRLSREKPCQQVPSRRVASSGLTLQDRF